MFFLIIFFRNQKDLEATVVLNSTIQRANEKNVMDYCREGFEKTRKVLKELESVTFDQKEDEDTEALYENIQALLGKINQLQTEINNIRENIDHFDKKYLTNELNELEKRIEKKRVDNDKLPKIFEILVKLQEEFEKIRSKAYVNGK